MLFLFKEHPDQVLLGTLFLHQSLVLKVKERIAATASRIAATGGLGQACSNCLACHYITQIELFCIIMMHEISDIPRVDK